MVSARSQDHTVLSSLGASEGLGTGRVCSMGCWLLGVAGKGIGLPQDGQVHQHLQQATDRELQGCTIEQEVGCLEGVPTCPHEHHLEAVETQEGDQRTGTHREVAV